MALRTKQPSRTFKPALRTERFVETVKEHTMKTTHRNQTHKPLEVASSL